MFDTTRTGSVLHREHETTLATLGQLEALLNKQGFKKPADMNDSKAQTAVRDTVATLSNEIGRHFAFEEEHLFPLLSQTGEDDIGEFLKEEHDSIRPLAEEAVELGRAALKGGFDEASWKRFHQIASELIEREMYHIQKEEMAVLAAISSVLDEAADRELAARYEMGG